MWFSGILAEYLKICITLSDFFYYCYIFTVILMTYFAKNLCVDDTGPGPTHFGGLRNRFPTFLIYLNFVTPLLSSFILGARLL